MARPEGLLTLRVRAADLKFLSNQLYDVGGSNIFQYTEYTKGPQEPVT